MWALVPRFQEGQNLTSWIWQSEFTWVRVSQTSWSQAALYFSATPHCCRGGVLTVYCFILHMQMDLMWLRLWQGCCISCSHDPTTVTSVNSLLNMSTKVKLSRNHSCCLEFSNFVFFTAVSEFWTTLLISYRVALFGLICWTWFVSVFLDWPPCVNVRKSPRAVAFCLPLLVFHCSCTGCGACPTLRLSVWQDSSLLQCVAQAHLPLAGTRAI